MRLPTLPNPLNLLLLVFIESWFASADQNVTIDDRDASVVLSPLRAWGWSDQGHGENGGTFSFSNTENATATFEFPQNATAVFWRGFKRSGPALYSVCIDCTDPSKAQIVDGHESAFLSTDSVTILFSKTDLSDSRHTLTITNLVDPRFALPSQITLDAFIITIPGSPLSSTSTSSTSVVASIPPTAMMDGPSPTTVAYWSEARPKAGLSTGAIVGIAFGIAISLLWILALVWWLLRRRQRVYGKVSGTISGYDHEKTGPASGELSPMSSTLNLPARNAEQATMFGTTPPPANLRHISYKVHSPPQFSATTPPTHSSRAPSIRSALSSFLSPTPSPRSASAPSEWGTIPVGISNPFASPHDADADSEFDFDTPFPSSSLDSSSISSERGGKVEAYTPVTVPPSGRQMPERQASSVAVSTSSPRGNDGDDAEGERTPRVSRGWRKIEGGEDSQTDTPPPFQPGDLYPASSNPTDEMHGTIQPLPPRSRGEGGGVWRRPISILLS